PALRIELAGARRGPASCPVPSRAARARDRRPGPGSRDRLRPRNPAETATVGHSEPNLLTTLARDNNFVTNQRRAYTYRVIPRVLRKMTPDLGFCARERVSA